MQLLTYAASSKVYGGSDVGNTIDAFSTMLEALGFIAAISVNAATDKEVFDLTGSCNTKSYC